jgi:hemerythrin superfamily protein
MPVTLKEIKELYTAGLSKDALERMLKYCEERGLSKEGKEVEELLAYYNMIDADLTITTDRKIAEISRVNKNISNLIQELEDLEKGIIKVEEPAIPKSDSLDVKIHKNTCNRDLQLVSFRKIKDIANKDQNIQFYYLIGEESDVVEGFIKRIAFDLRGNILGRLDSSRDSSVKVVEGSVDLNLTMGDLHYTLIDLKKGIFDLFDVDTTDPKIGSLEEKSFQYLIDHSPRFKDNSRKKIFVTYILVHETNWDEELVPQAFELFFQEFFDSIEADPAFEFLFFVGFEYEDQDDGEEIRQIIKDQSEQINGLEKIPALTKVSFKDIKRWFVSYKFMFEDSSSRNEKRDELFPDGDDKLYDMESVQRKLKKVIEEYNKRNLYG